MNENHYNFLIAQTHTFIVFVSKKPSNIYVTEHKVMTYNGEDKTLMTV